jgi:hypothetical protein
MIRTFFLSKKSLPEKFFSEALRNENSGDFVSAIRNYESVLEEIRKSRFPSNSLRSKTQEKLKVLRTVIEFNRSFL